MKKDDCIFCKIVEGEIPCFKIHEDKQFLAMLDIAQFVEGHTIIIPKKHYEFIWDVPNIGEYFNFVQTVGNHFRSLGFKYVDTLTFGRMVHHSHVHLIPHNGDNDEWKKALQDIGAMQLDEGRRINAENGDKIAKKFAL